ncbi:MAG: ribulokinase [Lentisphaeria bacterium]
MNSKLVIGLDFGTDSVRALLVNTLNGDIVSEAEHRYQRWADQQFCDSANFQFRQHPQDYLDGLTSVVRKVARGIEPEQIVGIGVDTTGSTVCAVDREGTPLALKAEFAESPDAMFLLWKDHTAIAEADEINRIASNWEKDYRRYVGSTYSCEWFWSKILHVLRKNPEVEKVAFSWVEHCDWIVGELTGNTDPLKMKRCRCAAGHKAMWHSEWGGLPPKDFLDAVDPRLGRLRNCLYTESQTADQPTGKLSPKWARILGLSPEAVIAGGQLDCHAGAVGAGILPGKLVKVVGTSTCDILVGKTDASCVRGISGQVEGSVLPNLTGFEAGQSAFGDIYRWFQQFLSAFGAGISIAEIEERAASISSEEVNNVLAIDWFNGRRSPDANPHLQGAIFGLTLSTTTEMVYRALVEATCCGARRIVERFTESGLTVNSITAVGGIARKSPFVMQTMANILNMPIEVLRSPQACALGSAMNAATAAKIYPALEKAMKAMHPGCDRSYTPCEKDVAEGEKKYRKYLIAAKLVEDFQ